MITLRRFAVSPIVLTVGLGLAPAFLGPTSSARAQGDRLVDLGRDPQLLASPSTALSASGEATELRRQIAEDAEFVSRQNRLIKNVYRLIEPSVVHLEARKAGASGKGSALEEAGSGVLLARGGKIWALTNRHVVDGAALAQIRVETSDGRAVQPTRVLSDVDSDIAVLELPLVGVTPAVFGNSDAIEIGDFALAVGSPFGLSRSITFGIVSAIGRRDLRLGTGELRFQDFLQTDAAINPGNSGGPLLNLRGEVVGINTAIASASGGSEGIGFAIPSNMALAVAHQLVDFGEVRRGYLGVRLDATFSASEAGRLGIPSSSGARVSGLTPESPAAIAQLRKGDVIVKFDGSPIRDDNHLMNLVSLTPVGKRVALVVFRDGKLYDLALELAERDAYEAP